MRSAILLRFNEAQAEKPGKTLGLSAEQAIELLASMRPRRKSLGKLYWWGKCWTNARGFNEAQAEKPGKTRCT